MTGQGTDCFDQGLDAEPSIEQRLTSLTRTSHGHEEGDATIETFFKHSAAKRLNTDAVIAKSLRQQYPNLQLVIVPAYNCNLLAYAQAGFAGFEPIEETGGNNPSSLSWDAYIPPARRLDDELGVIAERPLFGKFMYKWRGLEFILYLVDGRDGHAYSPHIENIYILTSTKDKAQSLIREAGQ